MANTGPLAHNTPAGPAGAALQEEARRIMLVAGTGEAISGPATGLTYETLRRHRIRTVIRPTKGRTTFTLEDLVIPAEVR